MRVFEGTFRVMHEGSMVRLVTQRGQGKSESQFKQKAEYYERTDNGFGPEFTFEWITCVWFGME